MKTPRIVSIAALLITSLTVAHAQTTITAWTFDNLSIAANPSPAASTGSGTASALGMTTALTSMPSISNPDIQVLAGSSSSLLGANNQAWRVRAKGTTPNTGNGWTSQAAIGTQGAEFDASTAGFSDIQISFDINESAQGEGNLQLQYTTDGSTWNNAVLSYSANTSLIKNNSTSANTVTGSYIQFNGAQWFNGITADLSGVSDANNNANFAIRIVNASTGADCVNSSGAALNNTSGNWNYDNVIISGVSAVPEPSTLALAGIGLVALVGFRRFKNSRA